MHKNLYATVGAVLVGLATAICLHYIGYEKSDAAVGGFLVGWFFRLSASN